MSDILKKYLTADRGTRIQALRLTQAWRTGLAHQDLPPVLVGLLGELAAASALLAGNIKFDGSVVLQLQGNGPVRLIMVECTSTLDLRATAHLRDDAAPPADATLQDLLNADGQGRFMVMLDPANRQAGAAAYQGIVPLEGDTVAAVLEHYMKHSEQLDTRLWLAADAQVCAGLLLQRMPGEAGPAGAQERSDAAEASWEHCATVADTLGREELRTTDTDTLIRRLFWEDDLLVFPERSVRWHCPCSRERVAAMLRTLGRGEVEDILAEQGHVHIACNFCGRPYDFDAVDCAALFTDAGGSLQAPGSDTLQ
ncbi:Hsp33 family molecular chaperone HslO [Castellaniella defragrans]|uniref:33 kDa chaperonin HSP33 n=2 Tax=Castellaniella defragrans TaxID=75697 RepID=W8WVM2_CASD6|nr:Hsp33 family molecular chaperone HslO [Castellaniella defragrans]KAB0598082.1 Hsp33 family molecular chaperone HslO [Castellaniella defragrans]MBB6085037.1 molecular chaperone Hsp33 [Castellaniella defragrans]CDM23614.1 33 kDa chaperonin HSP33 [Castellaniella defragrans 65Phen]